MPIRGYEIGDDISVKPDDGGDASKIRSRPRMHFDRSGPDYI